VDAAENITVSGAAKKEVKADDIKVHVQSVGKNRDGVAEAYDEIFPAGYVLGMSDVVKEY